MSIITPLNLNQFSDELHFSNRLNSEADKLTPSPWGLARFIRREVRRRGLRTRRELRKAIAPFLMASGFNGEAAAVIRDLADRMVDVGELVDLRVENQRGYSAMPSRWVKLSETEAVLLGIMAAESCDFSADHPRQFLRRFIPSVQTVGDLEKTGVCEMSFDDWLGEPAWKDFVETKERIESLQDLWNWHVIRLEEEGAPFSSANTVLLAIAGQPGDYFGKPLNRQNTRWKSPSELADGIYLGAQPGYSENHWHPVLLSISGNDGKSLLLNCRNDAAAIFELHNWLLVAKGAKNGSPEQVELYPEGSEIRCTFPLPKQLIRCLNLAGERSGPWVYSVSDPRSLGQLMARYFPEVAFLTK